MARVLLVEDTKVVRFALAALLRDQGHEVTEECDGTAAIRATREQDFDIVVTDVFMPALDGLELIRYLRQVQPTLKIIAISGGGARHTPEYAIDLASKLGADIVMQKPIENDDLIASVDSLIEKAA